MRRWRYKTLHFELKKDGILGNFFLDEEELERSLCRYGQDGWELVAVLEVQNGVVALCKQPFSEENGVGPESLAVSGREEEETAPDAEAEPRSESALGFRGVSRFVSDIKAETPVKTAAKPPDVKRPVISQPTASLFGEPEDDEPLAEPNIDSGGDEEGSGLSNIKIE